MLAGTHAPSLVKPFRLIFGGKPRPNTQGDGTTGGESSSDAPGKPRPGESPNGPRDPSDERVREIARHSREQGHYPDKGEAELEAQARHVIENASESGSSGGDNYWFDGETLVVESTSGSGNTGTMFDPDPLPYEVRPGVWVGE